MATLPALLRRIEPRGRVKGAARPGPLRAERDPFQLRPLPFEDVFLYCKKIDNSRLVREVDPQARGACWSAIGAACAAVLLLALLLAPSVAGTLAGYKLESLRAEERRLATEQRVLDLQEAGLLRPDRLEKLAKSQNMVRPASSQVMHLEPKAEAAVAMVQ
ncbi:MAG TPA: hypothetical protein VKT49_11435 [Bryobacteraceae bacterium]|nr:hypothetical protein [Bryobacteraceae bacterium]